ncbi:MAG: hypothetical protein QMC70_02620 [Bacteroidia bacterium]
MKRQLTVLMLCLTYATLVAQVNTPVLKDSTEDIIRLTIEES